MGEHKGLLDLKQDMGSNMRVVLRIISIIRHRWTLSSVVKGKAAFNFNSCFTGFELLSMKPSPPWVVAPPEETLRGWLPPMRLLLPLRDD
jgi:hypothetical protein